MKIVFERQTLIEGIAPAMTSVSGKNTIPSLEGILFEAKEGEDVKISSYDMKKGVVSSIKAERVVKEGKYIIPAQRLMQILRLMPDGLITIEVGENEKTTISSVSGHFSLKSFKGEEFPVLPDMPIEGSDRFMKIESAILKRAIGKVLHSIVDNDAKAFLCGAFFRVDKEGIEVVSCNNFILSRCNVRCELEDTGLEGDDFFSFIVPGHALNELVKLLDDRKEKVTVGITGKHALFKYENMMFFTRLIEETYMNYQRIIPTGLPIGININRNLFIEGIERVNLIAEEKDEGNKSYLKISVEDKVMQLSATSSSGNAFEEIGCEHTGDNIQIGFNGRFLHSCVKVIESEEIRIMMKSPTQSITIEPIENKEGEELFYLVLPRRMS